jgi:hypothetical protein
MCRCLNQNHKKLLGTPCLNDVTLVWVIFATFIFNCYSVIDSPTFYIARIQAIIVSSFYSMSTHAGPPFLDFVLPFMCFNREVQCMFHYLLVCINDVFPLSIASMASFSASSIHLPFRMIMIHLLTLHYFFFGNIFVLCKMLVWTTSPPMQHYQHHCALRPFCFNLQQVGSVRFAPTRGMNLNFLNMSQEVKNSKKSI